MQVHLRTILTAYRAPRHGRPACNSMQVRLNQHADALGYHPDCLRAPEAFEGLLTAAACPFTSAVSRTGRGMLLVWHCCGLLGLRAACLGTAAAAWVGGVMHGKAWED